MICSVSFANPRFHICNLLSGRNETKVLFAKPLFLIYCPGMINEQEEKAVEQARLILKGIIARKGVSYDELVRKLAAIGVEETVSGIKGKLHRGTFSFTWVLLCCKALGVDDLRLD